MDISHTLGSGGSSFFSFDPNRVGAAISPLRNFSAYKQLLHSLIAQTGSVSEALQRLPAKEEAPKWLWNQIVEDIIKPAELRECLSNYGERGIAEFCKRYGLTLEQFRVEYRQMMSMALRAVLSGMLSADGMEGWTKFESRFHSDTLRLYVDPLNQALNHHLVEQGSTAFELAGVPGLNRFFSKYGIGPGGKQVFIEEVILPLLKRELKERYVKEGAAVLTQLSARYQLDDYPTIVQSLRTEVLMPLELERLIKESGKEGVSSFRSIYSPDEASWNRLYNPVRLSVLSGLLEQELKANGTGGLSKFYQHSGLTAGEWEDLLTFDGTKHLYRILQDELKTKGPAAFEAFSERYHTLEPFFPEGFGGLKASILDHEILRAFNSPQVSASILDVRNSYRLSVSDWASLLGSSVTKYFGRSLQGLAHDLAAYRQHPGQFDLDELTQKSVHAYCLIAKLDSPSELRDNPQIRGSVLEIRDFLSSYRSEMQVHQLIDRFLDAAA